MIIAFSVSLHLLFSCSIREADHGYRRIYYRPSNSGSARYDRADLVGVKTTLRSNCPRSIDVFITIAVLTFKIVHKPRLLRFADEVKHVINPNDLQQWAILTLSKADTNSSEIPLKDVPAPIQEIKFDGCTIEMAFFDISPKSKNNCIHLMWEGGFGHWGIDVGAPSFEQPNDDHNNYVKWIPGVYFSEER